MLQPYRRRTNYGQVIAYPGTAAGVGVAGVGLQGLYNLGKRVYAQYSSGPSSKRRKTGKKEAKATVTSNTAHHGKVQRTSRKRRGLKKCTLKEVCKEVKRIRKDISAGDSWIEVREGLQSWVSAASNTCNWGEINLTSALVQTAMDNMRFYDSNTNLMENKDPDSLTQESSYRVTHRMLKITLANNYKVPVEISYAWFKPNSNHNRTFGDCMNETYGDMMTNGNPADKTDPYIQFSDGAEQRRQYWTKITPVKKIILQPGDNFTVYKKGEDFNYDPSVVDTVATTFIKSFKDLKFVWRQSGLVGHNSALTIVGLQDTQVDYDVKRVCRVHYESGGAPYRYIVLDHNYAATTASTLYRSQKPVAGNNVLGAT